MSISHMCTHNEMYMGLTKSSYELNYFHYFAHHDVYYYVHFGHQPILLFEIHFRLILLCLQLGYFIQNIHKTKLQIGTFYDLQI